jgi:hypothetical protein
VPTLVILICSVAKVRSLRVVLVLIELPLSIALRAVAPKTLSLTVIQL